MVLLIKTEDKMNHTTTKKNLVLIGVLSAITAAALTGTIAISGIQTVAAYNGDSNDPNSNNNNSTDIEKSITDFKQKEKNNAVALQPVAI
jgi:hypothetical protein